MEATYYISRLLLQPSAARARAYLGVGSGGVVNDVDVVFTDNLTGNASAAKHGFLPKLSGNTAQYLNGGGAWTAVTDAQLSLSDITTNDVSIARHGFAPKAPNDATKFLDGTGAYSVPAGGSGTVTNTGTLTDHGVVVGNGGVDVSALAVGATNTLLHGVTGADPSFSAVVEADITLADNTTNNVSTTKHGLAPKLPNDATKYLDGTGAYSIPSASGADPYYSYIESTVLPDGASGRTSVGLVGQAVGTNSASAASATQLQSLNYATTGSVDNDSYTGSTTNAWPFGRIGEWVCYALPVNNTLARYWFGVTDLNGPTQAASDTPTGNYCMFRYSTSAGDTNWQVVIGNGATTETFDSGVAVSNSQMVKLEVRWDGTAASSFTAYINGTLVATGTLNPASTTLLGFHAQVRTLTNLAKNVRHGGMKIRTKL